jgi:hypothetical protein
MPIPEWVMYNTSFAATAWPGIVYMSSVPASAYVPTAVGKNDWSATVNQGVVYLSASPATPSIPIAVGKNDWAATANPGISYLSTSPATADTPVAVGKNDYAATANLGLVYLATAPITASEPVSVGANQEILTTAPLTGGGNLYYSRTISMAAATASTDGYLVGSDWNRFNAKPDEAPVDGTIYGRQDAAWVPAAVTATYTNLNSIVTPLGGIAVGDTFPTQPIQDVLDKLLYPYQSPTFASFIITGQSTTLEVGDTTNANPSFAWATTSTYNITANSIGIVDTTAAETLVTGHSVTSPAAITHAGVVLSSAGNHVYTISGVNTHGVTFTRTFTITAYWRRFYGESASSPLNEAEIKALRVSGLASSYATTYVFVADASKYKWICFPSSWGTPSSFKDASTGFAVPFETAVTVSVTNSFGSTTNYDCYRSSNMLGGAISVIVT